MLSFCGYNFCSDGDSANPAPTNVANMNYAQIQNAIFDGVYITNNPDEQPVQDPQTLDWSRNTVMLAHFRNNIDAGKVGGGAGDLYSIRIKRYIANESDTTAVTIKEIIMGEDSSGEFIVNDYLTKNNVDYQYIWVPVSRITTTGGNVELVEGEGIKLEEAIHSKFDGVFIADSEYIYKFYTGVAYGSNSRVQQLGIFTPLGKQYPVYVSNGQSDYQTGSVQGRILSKYQEFTADDTGRQNRVQEKEILQAFLANKKAKVIKDWNGQSWLVFVTGNPAVSYDNSYGMGMMSMNFDWSEVGKPDNVNDLRSAGLIPAI